MIEKKAMNRRDAERTEIKILIRVLSIFLSAVPVPLRFVIIIPHIR